MQVTRLCEMSVVAKVRSVLGDVFRPVPNGESRPCPSVACKAREADKI
jgi:hypothetical protein